MVTFINVTEEQHQLIFYGEKERVMPYFDWSC